MVVTAMALEQHAPQPRRREHDEQSACGYLRDFLRYRRTDSKTLGKLRAQHAPGAYASVSGPDPDDPGHAPRHEMAAPFTHAVHNHLLDPDLMLYPDWTWIGWERELRRLEPVEENKAVQFVVIQNLKMDLITQLENVASNTMHQRVGRGLLKMTKALLARNAP